MSQPKHTPGPWTPAELDEDTWTKSSEIEGRSKHLNEPVCIIPHDDITDDGWQEVKANARLIAAAPEMLEALQAVQKYLDALVVRAKDGDYEVCVQGAIARGEDLNLLFDTFMNKTVAAIAKATGGAE